MITLLAPYWAVNVREGNDTARTETRHRSSAWPGPQEHLTCVTIFLQPHDCMHIVDHIDQVGYPVRVMYFFQVGSPYSFRRFSCGSVLFHHRVSEMQMWCCTKYPMIADTGNSRKNNIVTVEKGTSLNLANKDPKPSSPCCDKAVQNLCLSTWKVELKDHTLLVKAPAIITRWAYRADGHVRTFCVCC